MCVRAWSKRARRSPVLSLDSRQADARPAEEVGFRPWPVLLDVSCSCHPPETPSRRTRIGTSDLAHETVEFFRLRPDNIFLVKGELLAQSVRRDCPRRSRRVTVPKVRGQSALRSNLKPVGSLRSSLAPAPLPGQADGALR